MIKQFHIMKENGILLYSKSNSDEQYNEDILTGFFASIANFSREALNTAIHNLDLGGNNKLVLCPIPGEKLLAAAIVNSRDNNELIMGLMRDITQDFVDEYAPNFIRENINISYVDEIFDKNAKTKQAAPLFQRLLINWLILGPLSVILMFVTSFLSQALFDIMGLYQSTYVINDILTFVMPGFFLIATIINLILFIVPNLINGNIMIDRKWMYINSVIYAGITMLEFAIANVMFMVSILLAYIPLVLIISIFFSVQGYENGRKKRLVPK